MKYTEEFIEAVKATFPDNHGLHRDLDMGLGSVGRYLGEHRNFEMSADAIVKAFDNKNENLVYEAAKKAMSIQKLYSEWSEQIH